MTRIKVDEFITLADEVALKRKAMGANLSQFAAMIGLRPTVENEQKIAAYELGTQKPTPAQINRLSRLPFEPPMKKNKAQIRFKFIDLFAGIGGIRIPFEEAGGECVFTSEWDKDCQITYAANFGEVPNGDITKIQSSAIPEHDLLLAGFPCQAFSQAGLKQGFYDTRGTMFFEIQRIIGHHGPAIILLENVKQLVGHDKGKTLKTILGILRGTLNQKIPDEIPMSDEARRGLGKKLNYAVDFRVLSSNRFGVPQKRERVFIIGLNKDIFGDVSDADVTSIFDALSNEKHETRIMGDILEQNVNVPIEFTISERLWSGHLRRRKEHKKKGNGFGYSLFDATSPTCNTISQRYYKDGSEVLIDQSDIGKNPRLLMPRECARLQGFPEDFYIDAVSKVQNYRQFGNSVAVPVVRAISNKLKKYLHDCSNTK